MKLTPEQIAQAHEWKRDGRPPQWMARQFGCNADTVQRAIDPELRDRRNMQISAASAARREQRYHGDGMRVERVIVPGQVLADRARCNDATLTPNQIVLGDPIKGRSALDKLMDGSR